MMTPGAQSKLTGNLTKQGPSGAGGRPSLKIPSLVLHLVAVAILWVACLANAECESPEASWRALCHVPSLCVRLIACFEPGIIESIAKGSPRLNTYEKYWASSGIPDPIVLDTAFDIQQLPARRLLSSRLFYKQILFFT